MRTRRQHLQVSTFPFLAVLLCAMGALILVLLSMDRKAKRAALYKAQDEAKALVHKRLSEHDKLAESRRRDYDAKKRSTRQAYDKKRDALTAQVNAEELALTKELAEVQSRLAEAARKIREEEGGLDELRKELDAEKELLTRQEQAVAAARSQAKGAAQQISASDKARAKLSAELRRLEKALADAGERRKKDTKAYSLIPYGGKRGEDRRPIYVECAHAGFVFHPEKKATNARAELHAELKARVVAQQEKLKAAGAGDSKPYVLLLVRPDAEAIGRFYVMQAEARELGVDFGYEFVEADWAFQFSTKTDVAPKEAVATLPKATRPAVRLAPEVPIGTVPPLPHIGKEARESAIAGLDRPAVRLVPGGGGKVDDEEFIVSDLVQRGPPGGAQTSAKPVQDGSPWTGGATKGPADLGTPVGKANPSGGVTANGGGSRSVTLVPDSPVLNQGSGGSTGGQPALLSPSIQTPTSGTQLTPSAPGDTVLLPPIGTHSASGGGTTSRPTQPSAIAGEQTGKPLAAAPKPGPSVAKSDAEPRIGPATPEPADAKRQAPRILRPARLSGGGESIVFIECKGDVVIVHPTRRQVPVEKLNHSAAYNPLYLAVQQQAQARQRLAKPGDAVKVHVRFLVHPDGEQTFHLAYPGLDPLKLSMSRYSLQKWDDVSRIVAEY